MSYHHGSASGEFEEQDSPDDQHLHSKTSSHLERAQNKEREKEDTNKKLRRNDSPRSSNDQFVSNDHYSSSPRKLHVGVGKKPSNVHQSVSAAFAEGSALPRAKMSKSFHLGTKSHLKMESWKKPEDLEKAKEVHHQKFQATLDSLVEEFESGASATRTQNINTVRVRFRVHYVTHSPRQILAVTGNHDNLGTWKSFIPLNRTKDGYWICTTVFPMDVHVEWKFVVVEDGEIVRWEECGNRTLEVSRKVEDKEIQLYCTWGCH